ncbi:MAG: hypothetical protein Q9192_003063 [Flavoplaca navasiana]
MWAPVVRTVDRTGNTGHLHKAKSIAQFHPSYLEHKYSKILGKMAGIQDMHAAPSLLTLPTEIVSEVYSYLHKEDLKSVRLSCHCLDEITRPILFDKVVITSLGNNASLFDCVVDNPQLAQYVKTIVVDVLRFRGFSAAYYIEHLVRQLEHDVARHLPAFALTPPAAVLFKKLRKAKWFKNRRRTRDRIKALAVFDLDHSYDTYIAVHDSQKGCVGSSLSRCVARALSKCVKVQELEVQTEWLPYDRPVDATLESLLPRFSSSGIVARHHNPLLLRPMPPKEDDCSHRRFLLQLFEAVDKVTNLKLGKGAVTLPDQLDALEPLGFKHLANLTLWIPGTFSPNLSTPVNRLTPALQNARTLKQLNVGCSNTTSFEHVNMFRLRLLPLLQGCLWPQLVSLKLSGMVASASDLSSLFEGHKGIKSLSMGSMDLCVPSPPTDGVEVCEAKISRDVAHLFWNMRRLMNLAELSLEPPFRAQISRFAWRPIGEDFAGFKAKWEGFVLHHDPLNPMPGVYEIDGKDF